MIAKWLAAEPRVIVLDEPTAGIDIGSKSEIVALIRELASQGKAVIIISSELAELLAASDRIVVMSNGELVRDISREELDAATAGAADPAERQQLAERQLQLALQHRAQQFTRLLGTGPNGEAPEIAANIQLTEERDRADPGDERARGDRAALRRQRLVARPGRGAAGASSPPWASRWSRSPTPASTRPGRPPTSRRCWPSSRT